MSKPLKYPIYIDDTPCPKHGGYYRYGSNNQRTCCKLAENKLYRAKTIAQRNEAHEQTHAITT